MRLRPRPSYSTAWYVLIILCPSMRGWVKQPLDSNISSSPCRKVEGRSPVHSGVKTMLTLTAATAERRGSRWPVYRGRRINQDKWSSLDYGESQAFWRSFTNYVTSGVVTFSFYIFKLFTWRDICRRQTYPYFFLLRESLAYYEIYILQFICGPITHFRMCKLHISKGKWRMSFICS